MIGFDGLDREMECSHFACAGIDPRGKLVLWELGLGRGPSIGKAVGDRGA